MAVVVAEAAKNETILRRAQERELELLQSASLEELFENLVNGLKRSFGLDQVSVILWDPEYEVRHLLLFNNAQQQHPTGVVFCDELSDVSPIFAHLKGPALGAFASDLHSGLFPSARPPASTAVLPLRRNQKLVGSLNFGSSDAKRFTRYHATDFLQHLAVIAAFCLENNINRSKLLWAGLTDVLTGWHNRRYLEARLPEEFALAARGSETLSFLLFDIDYFKRVNDQHGHAAGDQVLREIAQRAQKEIRLSDVAARYGGEEFIIVLPRTALCDAMILAERIRTAISRTPIRVNEQVALTLSVSIGASSVTPSEHHQGYERQWRAALESADQAMYTAKSNGRNQVAMAQSKDLHRD